MPRRMKSAGPSCFDATLTQNFLELQVQFEDEEDQARACVLSPAETDNRPLTPALSPAKLFTSPGRATFERRFPAC